MELLALGWIASLWQQLVDAAMRYRVRICGFLLAVRDAAERVTSCNTKQGRPQGERRIAMWIDSRCENTFHEIKKVDGKWIVLHGDGSICEVVEFDVSDLVEG